MSKKDSTTPAPEQGASQEEQLVMLGNDAEVLLNTPVFNQTINSLVEATFQSFVNSKPENKHERESSYHHYRALVDIVNTLKQRVSVRDEIDSKNQSDNSNKE
jgi:cytidylate kinase